MKIVLSFFLFLVYSFLYSQKTIDVVFNNIDVVYKEGFKGLDTINALKANIKTKYGNFSIQLIDNNKNGKFNDLGIDSDEMNLKHDSFQILKYNSEYKSFIFDPTLRLKNNLKFVFNGVLFRLFNLEKTKNNIYIAKLAIIKKHIDFKVLYKNYTLSFVDRLNSICITDLKSKNKINIKDILSNKKLYILPINASLELESPNFNNIKYAETIILSNIDLIYLVVQSKKKIAENFINFKKLKHKVFYISTEEYKKLFLLGFNEIHRGLLFNKKGKLINDGIFPFDISKYDN